MADPIVTLSAGTAITAADIAMFDARWTQAVQHEAALGGARWKLYERVGVGVWETGDHMSALVRIYELTLDRRFLDQLRDFIEAALLFRDDRHPGGLSETGEVIPVQPLDEFRGLVMPGWGGKSPNSGGLHHVAEVVSSAYAYPIAAFARIVAEDPTLHTTYGQKAVEYTNAILEMAWAFMPQVVYRDADGLLEAHLKHVVPVGPRPTERDCEDAYQAAVDGDPQGDHDRYGRMLKSCKNVHRVAGQPMAHNENQAFMMVLIELFRALDSVFYRQSPDRSVNAEPTRTLIPLLVSRQQRYFANRLKTVEDHPDGARFVWNYADDQPPGIGTHRENISHAALTMRYVELLRRDYDRLNALPATVGEPIPLDSSYLRRFANTFLQKIAAGTNLAHDIEGNPGDPKADNGEAGGWVSLAVVNQKVYHECHNVLLRIEDGAQPFLTISNHAALLMSKRYAGRYLYFDRSGPFRAPKAVGAPAGIVFPALGVTNIVYRDANGQLHELWQKGAESGTTNLSERADNAIRTAGEPTSYIATKEGQEVALYRGTDGHVHSLYWSTGAVGRDALSGTAGAPQAAGNPVGVVALDGMNQVIYRSGDGHLRSLWWTGTNAPGGEDLTGPSGALSATGDPAPYINTNTGENIVVYRAVDGHIHTLYWTTGAVGHDNLSGFAHSPPAAGDPVAYYTHHSDTHQVTYRSDDGHLHELWWVGNDPVRHFPLTAGASGAPIAASDPAAYYSAGTNTKHVIYRSADGHLNELWWVPGSGSPGHVDLTDNTLAPLATDNPAAFTVEGPNSQHVVYRGIDGRIYEIRWT